MRLTLCRLPRLARFRWRKVKSKKYGVILARSARIQRLCLRIKSRWVLGLRPRTTAGSRHGETARRMCIIRPLSQAVTTMLDKIFLFAGEHFVLVATFIVLVGIFFYTESLRGGEAVSPQQVSNLVNRAEALVIDLRSGDAFRKGHIHGSENVPEDKFDGELA